jgi:hypothetical protein
MMTSRDLRFGTDVKSRTVSCSLSPITENSLDDNTHVDTACQHVHVALHRKFRSRPTRFFVADMRSASRNLLSSPTRGSACKHRT